jgi:hypothetical protein
LTSEEILHEMENVERVCVGNTAERDVYAVIARGIWVIALHLARLSEATCKEIKDLGLSQKS